MPRVLKASVTDQKEVVSALVDAAGVGIRDIEAGRYVKIDNGDDLDAHFDNIAQNSISKIGESHAA
jgi:hypothetical protein